jgi:hypothetical protein
MGAVDLRAAGQVATSLPSASSCCRPKNGRLQNWSAKRDFMRSPRRFARNASSRSGWSRPRRRSVRSRSRGSFRPMRAPRPVGAPGPRGERRHSRGAALPGRHGRIVFAYLAAQGGRRALRLTWGSTCRCRRAVHPPCSSFSPASSPSSSSSRWCAPDAEVVDAVRRFWPDGRATLVSPARRTSRAARGRDDRAGDPVRRRVQPPSPSRPKARTSCHESSPGLPLRAAESALGRQVGEGRRR